MADREEVQDVSAYKYSRHSSVSPERRRRNRFEWQIRCMENRDTLRAPLPCRILRWNHSGLMFKKHRLNSPRDRTCLEGSQTSASVL